VATRSVSQCKRTTFVFSASLFGVSPCFNKAALDVVVDLMCFAHVALPVSMMFLPCGTPLRLAFPYVFFVCAGRLRLRSSTFKRASACRVAAYYERESLHLARSDFWCNSRPRSYPPTVRLCRASRNLHYFSSYSSEFRVGVSHAIVASSPRDLAHLCSAKFRPCGSQVRGAH